MVYLVTNTTFARVWPLANSCWIKVSIKSLLCLLERLGHLGPGARAAGERRKVVQGLEEVRRRQAQAYQIAHRNRGLCRVGRAFVP